MFLPFDSILLVWVVYYRSLKLPSEGSDMVIHVTLTGRTETNGPSFYVSTCLCTLSATGKCLVHDQSPQTCWAKERNLTVTLQKQKRDGSFKQSYYAARQECKTVRFAQLFATCFVCSCIHNSMRRLCGSGQHQRSSLQNCVWGLMRKKACRHGVPVGLKSNYGEQPSELRRPTSTHTLCPFAWLCFPAFFLWSVSLQAHALLFQLRRQRLRTV